VEVNSLETKVCIKCNAKKIIEEYPKYKDRNGNYAYRNVCKTCFNIQSNKTKVKKTKNLVKNESNTEYEIIKPVGKSMLDLFSDSEILILKSLINNHNDIMAIVNNKLELSKIEDIKTKKSISISETIHKKILELSNKSNLNYSQVIENLIKKALENV